MLVRYRGSCYGTRQAGGMVCFAGCACLYVRDVVWCQSDAKSVRNCLQKGRSVQFACLIWSTASSFSSVQGTAAKSLRSVRSVQFVQFSSRTLPALVWRDLQPPLPSPGPATPLKQVGMLWSMLPFDIIITRWQLICRLQPEPWHAVRMSVPTTLRLCGTICWPLRSIYVYV